MKTRRINVYLFVGMIGLFTTGPALFTQMYRAFWGQQNIWWTHSNMKLRLEETGNDFALYISGRLLQKHLAEGTLSGVDQNGAQYRVVSKDVGVRLNNWERVKATILATAGFAAFTFGMSVAFLIVGLVQRAKEKKG